MKSIAETVAELRAREGLTQQELADLLYVSRSLVAMWEAGERIPDGVSVAEMARIFGVSERDIAGEPEYAYGSPHEMGLISAEIGEFTGSAPSGVPVDKRLGVLKDFLASRSKKDVDIFMGRYFYMKTFKTIANELNMNEAAVRVRLGRLRKKLNSALGKEEEK
jgi:transcriptional regulator with XRE-family HTH domain